MLSIHEPLWLQSSRYFCLNHSYPLIQEESSLRISKFGRRQMDSEIVHTGLCLFKGTIGIFSKSRFSRIALHVPHIQHFVDLHIYSGFNARPSPEKPSWDTLIPATRLAKLSFCETSHSASLQFMAYSIPATNVSPAPIGLEILMSDPIA